MLPAMATSGFLIDQLDEALAKGPQLKTSERVAMADDVRPFLFQPREDRLVTMFPQYIQQVLK